MIRKIAFSALLAGACTAPAHAADEMVSAHDPQGMFAALEGAGYEATLDKDGLGDPLITLELGGWNTIIYFYGCDEAAHDKCDSLQLRTGFDREAPWTHAEAMEITRKYRFSGVHLDEEGDPFVSWDLVTGEGIPRKVLLLSIRKYEQALHNASRLIFASERAEGAK